MRLLAVQLPTHGAVEAQGGVGSGRWGHGAAVRSGGQGVAMGSGVSQNYKFIIGPPIGAAKIVLCLGPLLWAGVVA
jgi:hypothetical protein